MWVTQVEWGKAKTIRRKPIGGNPACQERHNRVIEAQCEITAVPVRRPLFESGECIVYFTNGNPACPGAGATQNPAGRLIFKGVGKYAKLEVIGNIPGLLQE